jgi:hypothetical protein
LKLFALSDAFLDLAVRAEKLPEGKFPTLS